MEITPALRMKSACLDWLRFDRRCTILATEVGRFSSDVLGLGKSLYEIEIKVSTTDFLADFKKDKHLRYADGHPWTPDYFYFCVPSPLVHWASNLMREKGLPYGVMEHCRENKIYPWGEINRNWIEVALRAKKLNAEQQNIDLISKTMRLRMGSEICRAYHKMIGSEEDE